MSNSVWPHRRQPPGSPVPGILQARTLEWVAISFSSAWKWKVRVKSLSRVRLFETPWTVVPQTPLSMGFSRQEYWSGLPLPSPDSSLEHSFSALALLTFCTRQFWSALMSLWFLVSVRSECYRWHSSSSFITTSHFLFHIVLKWQRILRMQIYSNYLLEILIKGKDKVEGV